MEPRGSPTHPLTTTQSYNPLQRSGSNYNLTSNQGGQAPLDHIPYWSSVEGFHTLVHSWYQKRPKLVVILGFFLGAIIAELIYRSYHPPFSPIWAGTLTATLACVVECLPNLDGLAGLLFWTGALIFLPRRSEGLQLCLPGVFFALLFIVLRALCNFLFFPHNAWKRWKRDAVTGCLSLVVFFVMSTLDTELGSSDAGLLWGGLGGLLSAFLMVVSERAVFEKCFEQELKEPNNITRSRANFASDDSCNEISISMD